MKEGRESEPGTGMDSPGDQSGDSKEGKRKGRRKFRGFGGKKKKETTPTRGGGGDSGAEPDKSPIPPKLEEKA